MKRFTGKSVYKGIAIGPVALLKKDDQQVKRVKIDDTEMEIFRIGKAGKQTKEQLAALYEKAVKEVGEASATIFEVHQMMLEDEDYLESIHNMIRIEKVNAEYAVAVTGDNYSFWRQGSSRLTRLPGCTGFRLTWLEIWRSPVFPILSSSRWSL